MSEPIFRLDWLMRSPGIIRSAAVYSGFLIEDTLYFLRTGPGWQRLSGAYAAYNVVANPIIERQINKNREAHAAIAGWDFATEVPQRADMAYRLTAIKSNWFSEIEGEFDLIVSNPPYISDAEMAELSLDVLNHDPHLALTPGGDGLAPYEVLAKGARKHLAANGRILVEIGYRQGPDVVRIFQDAGLAQVACHKDLNGHDRVVSAHQS